MKKIFQISLHLTITAFFLFGLASCVKDYFDMDKIADTKWTPKVALPMVYSSLSINDIIKMSKSEGLFQIGADNFVTLVYKGNILSLRADEVVRIDTMNNSNSINIYVPAPDIPVVLAGGSVNFNSSQTINFNSGQTLIDSMIYKSGTLDINIFSNVQHNVQIVLSIPSLKKNGVAYSSTLTLNYFGSIPVNATSSLDLTGYTIDMTQGGTTSNQFNIDYSVTVTGTGNPLSSSDNITVFTGFNQNKFDKLFGYIGQQLIAPNIDTISVGLFSNAEGDTIYKFFLVDPSVKLFISNGYGLPINARFNILEGYRPGESTFPLMGNGSQNGILPSTNFISLPFPSSAEVGQSKSDSVVLTSTESNIAPFISKKPKYFVYQLEAQSNPPPPAIQTKNFVIDSSLLKVDAEIWMPLWGNAVVFTVQDTFPFQLPSGDEIDSLLLRIHVANGFPLDVNMQIYFVDTEITSFDTLYHVLDFALDSSQNTNILTAAPIDGNGKAIGKIEKDIDQWLDSKKLSNMAKAEYIFIRGNMTTSNGGNSNIKIYSDYKLDVKIGVMAKLKQTVSFH